MYRHIYLSPHLDDAALSCGAAIAAQVAAGEPALVVNICAGSPAPGAAFSPFAQEQHRKWGLPPEQAVRLRRAEDDAALAILGAQGLHLDLLDAIYRLPEAYRDEATLFGALAPDDPLVAAVVAAIPPLLAASPGATLHAPLGVGYHVDHQAAHRAALELARSGAPVLFYADFPYAARPGAVARRLAEVGDGLRPAGALPGQAELDRKVAAVAAYASQIDVLFRGLAQMEAAVRAHVERSWEQANR